jgi:hypothetical protein
MLSEVIFSSEWFRCGADTKKPRMGCTTTYFLSEEVRCSLSIKDIIALHRQETILDYTKF